MARNNISASRLFYERNQDLLLGLFGLLAMILGGGAGLLVIGVASPLRLFVILLGITALVATVARIEWGLLVLIFIVYTRFSDIAINYHGAPSFAKAFLLVIVLAILVRWGLYGERPKGWGRAILLVTAYATVGLASVLYAADPARAQNSTLDFLKDGAITIVVTMLLHDGLLLRRAIWTLLLVAIFLGSLSAFQYLTGTLSNNYGGFAQAAVRNIVGEVNDYRVAGPIGDPNFYALIMVVFVPLALDRVWNERRFWLRLIAAWALTVSALAIVFTFSRGGFIALLVIAAVLMFYHRYRPVYWLTAIALGLAVLQFVPPLYTDRLRTILDFVPGVGSKDARLEPSFRGRTSETLVAWQMFSDYPIVGVGIGNYPVHYQDYSRRLGIDPRAEFRSAHNLFLEIAAETGLVGLFVFGVILWVVFRGLQQARKLFMAGNMRDYAEMTAALAFGLVGYLAASMFIHAAYPRYFWLLVGIALSIPEVAKNELNAREQALEEIHQAATARSALASP